MSVDVSPVICLILTDLDLGSVNMKAGSRVDNIFDKFADSRTPPLNFYLPSEKL